MHKTSIHNIRKITLGDNPLNEGMAFSVGQSVFDGAYNVSRIVCNENNFHFFGFIRYEIYVKKKSEQEPEEKLWKWYEKGLLGECDLNK